MPELDDLSESERAALRQETLAKFAARRETRVGESVQAQNQTTPHEETTTKTVVSPTSSGDPYGLPTLSEGLAHRLGIDEKREEVSAATRKNVMEKTLGKFNAIMGLFGAEPVKLNEVLPFKGKSAADKAVTRAQRPKPLTRAELDEIVMLEDTARNRFMAKADIDIQEWLTEEERNRYVNLRIRGEGDCPNCGHQGYQVPCPDCEYGEV
jgi:hypothetical protein